MNVDRSDAAKILLLAAIYFTTAKLGLLIHAVGGFATTVWPPTGIALAALFLFGFRMWPGVAAGAFLVNLTAGAPWMVAAGMATGNTLEALLATYLLRRVVHFRGSFDRIQGVVGFVVFAAGLSTTVAATIGVLSGWWGGVIPSPMIGRAWLTWWLGDAMGALIVAPLLLVWMNRPRYEWSAWRWIESGSLLVGLTALSLLVFGQQMGSGRPTFLHPYMLFPFLIWSALRFWQHGTVSASVLVASIATWGTARGLGPFAVGTINDSLLLLQAFMGVVSVTMLIFAAEAGERRRTEMRNKVNHSVARVLVHAPTLEAVIPGILEAMCESLDWDCGNVWTVDAADKALWFATEWHRPQSSLKEFGLTAAGMSLGPGEGMAGRVWSEARPIWVTNVSLDKNFVRARAASRIGLRSALGIPIFVGREVQAVLTFFSLRSQEPDDALLQQMATLGTQIGQFVQRRRAEEDLRLAHAELEARIARRTQQLSQANETLQIEIGEREQAEESLRQLSARLLRIQDDERQRLARELHDSTAQTLAALAMNLAVVRAGRAKLAKRSQQSLDEAEVLAEMCAREIRSLSYVLHPPLLKEIGLPAAVRWCAEGFTKRSGIAVDVDLPTDFGRLPVEVETALFRIVQECLTNVQRHSGSPTARVELFRQNRSVGLRVKDQGRGIPPGILRRRSSLGVGLLGMRERVRQLGGRLSIDSTGTGATVQVDIELPPEAA